MDVGSDQTARTPVCDFSITLPDKRAFRAALEAFSRIAESAQRRFTLCADPDPSVLHTLRIRGFGAVDIDLLSTTVQKVLSTWNPRDSLAFAYHLGCTGEHASPEAGILVVCAAQVEHFTRWTYANARMAQLRVNTIVLASDESDPAP